MKRLLLSATMLACLPGALQAELPGNCVPGHVPKRACQTLVPRQVCPQTCAPQHTGCQPRKRCFIKDSLGRIKDACPLKNPCSLKSTPCPLKSSCLPRTSGCLSRFKDGACRLITQPVRTACKSVCNLGRPKCATDTCCNIKRIVIHSQPCCPPQQPCVAQQPCVVMMPQNCCVPQTYQVMPNGAMIVPQMTTSSSQQQIEDRLSRLEAEVSSLVRQVELQNESIQRR